jgi:restriction system protein
MARKKSSSAEDFVKVVALMPWWVGVALAIISFVFLHALSKPPTGVLVPGQIGDWVARSMVSAFAFAGQIFVPLLFLVGAVVSLASRRKRESLVESAQSRGADGLNGMSWREFEMLVGEAFRLQGYAVTESGAAGPDGGVDLVLRKGREVFLVQCKQWKAFKVSVEIVRELYGVMAAQGAAGGFVVTSGNFTADAQDFAKGRNVHLVDGPKLFGLIQQAKASMLKTAAAAPAPQPNAPLMDAQAGAPTCPLCQSAMVRRTAKKGPNVGALFWGCSKFPACRGTR